MRKVKLIIAAILILGPLCANASLIRYEFVGSGNGGSTGYLDFNDAATGPGDIMAQIVDWSFLWNGLIIDSGNSLVSSASSFIVDAALMYLGGGTTCFNASGGSCIDNESLFAFDGSLDGGSGRWRMIQGGQDSGVQFSMSVSGPTSVPEPGTLALLGIGLFGMGLARRRKKV